MMNPPAVFSLSHAVRVIARESGLAHELDDVNALLGLSVMFCAVPGERDVSRWPLYARDAFLIDGGRALGLTIRPIHPPEAARGLDSAQEFGQHFDASYRPLMLRALENGQAVLAWRGWASPHDLFWGVIDETCDEGMGFRGRIFAGISYPSTGNEGGGSADPTPTTADASYANHAVCLLERPAIQLYVVESASGGIERDQWLRVALKHAAAVLNDEVGDRFGVVTGPKAYDAWRRATDETKSLDTQGATLRGVQMASLTRSAVAAYESAVRFLAQHRVAAPIEWHSRLSTLERECQNIVMTLKPMGDAECVGGWLATDNGRAIVTAKIVAACEATHLMRTALIGLA